MGGEGSRDRDTEVSLGPRAGHGVAVGWPEHLVPLRCLPGPVGGLEGRVDGGGCAGPVAHSAASAGADSVAEGGVRVVGSGEPRSMLEGGDDGSLVHVWVDGMGEQDCVIIE